MPERGCPPFVRSGELSQQANKVSGLNLMLLRTGVLAQPFPNVRAAAITALNYPYRE